MASALLLVGAVALPAPAQAQDPSLEDQQTQLRQDELQKAAEVDTLTADAAEVDAAITTLDANVAYQRARAEDAEAAVALAKAAQADAEGQRADAEARREALRQELSEVAIVAYVRPPADDLARVLADEDPNASAKRSAFAAARTRSVADVIDQMRAASETARRAGERASEALAAAEAAAALERRALADLDDALDGQRELAADVGARLDRALSEAAAISGRSQELADAIVAREQKLAARVTTPSYSPRPSWVSSGVEVTTVRGIEVNVLIADQLEALLAAAEADGVELTGSGYRDIETQIYLRTQHCGSSDYAIWEMPSGECSPPVARPGYSMHEQGLAIDFIIGDDLIRSRGTSAYEWLSEHAHEYGLYNLPSEPWHWSTTGS